MGVPAAVINRRHARTDIHFQYLREGFEGIGKFCARPIRGILRIAGRDVIRRFAMSIERLVLAEYLQHFQPAPPVLLHGAVTLVSLLQHRQARRMKMRIAGQLHAIHARHGNRVGAGEQRSRGAVADSNHGGGTFHTLRRGQARQPAARRIFIFRRAALDEILRFEMAARAVGEPAGMDDGQVTGVIQFFQRGGLVVKAEIAIGKTVREDQAGIVAIALDAGFRAALGAVDGIGRGADEVQPIAPAAQENHHQYIVVCHISLSPRRRAAW